MTGKRSMICAKCGINSKDDSSLTFHRFPLPSVRDSLKAKVWAKFCFPDEDWTSDQSLRSLYKQHKMLCGKHFDDSSFTNSDRKRMNKFAIPNEAHYILAELRNKLFNSSAEKPITQMDHGASTSTSQNSISMEFVNENKLSTQNLAKESHKNHGIIKEIDVKTLADLTPREQQLYKRCRKNLTEILRLRKKFAKVNKQSRNFISSLESNSAVNNIIKSKLSYSSYLLLQSQLKNNSRKLAGRRWTLDDKVLALSIYKKSSSCYRLLRRLFCLPSISSLKSLLNKVPMQCGINDQIVHTIKDITEKRTVEENLCMLAFDEMAIRKNLTYNIKLDQIDGYQDHAAQGRTEQVASKALTFMAIGVRKNWKQPIAFYFSGAYVTADRLAIIIKEVLNTCFTCGLIVIGTVCDCDLVNLRALNLLGSTKMKPFFDYDGHEIVTVLDPPHLLKCFRNNFMKHNVVFPEDIQIDGQQKTGVAKWIHIEKFYKLEKANPNFVFAPALTQQHLQPNGKQKMKVRLAAQILSHSVAAGLYAKIALNELPQEAIATAEVVSKLDKLFDAVNGDTPDRKRGKPLLTNMSSTSPHLNFFNEMKKFFTEVKFLGARSNPPSQDGWLRTINAIEKLFFNLKKQGINSLSLRRLNQDPLENCFGCIRSNCGANPNPTSVQFIAALKTSIITNLINSNKNRNCLDDSNGLLNNFKIFLNKGTNDTKLSFEESEKENSFTLPVKTTECVKELKVIPECSGEMQACAYVSGFIVRTMEINCKDCKNIFLSDQNTEICHLFTSFKEYEEKASLNYIHPNLCKLVENAATLINDFLNKNSFKRNVKVNLRKICENINYNWLNGCKVHQYLNKEKIVENTMAICIKRFCINKNRGFIEEASKQSCLRRIKILKNV